QPRLVSCNTAPLRTGNRLGSIERSIRPASDTCPNAPIVRRRAHYASSHAQLGEVHSKQATYFARRPPGPAAHRTRKRRLLAESDRVRKVEQRLSLAARQSHHCDIRAKQIEQSSIAETARRKVPLERTYRESESSGPDDFARIAQYQMLQHLAQLRFHWPF